MTLKEIFFCRGKLYVSYFYLSLVERELGNYLYTVQRGVKQLYLQKERFKNRSYTFVIMRFAMVIKTFYNLDGKVNDEMIYSLYALEIANPILKYLEECTNPIYGDIMKSSGQDEVEKIRTICDEF